MIQIEGNCVIQLVNLSLDSRSTYFLLEGSEFTFKWFHKDTEYEIHPDTEYRRLTLDTELRYVTDMANIKNFLGKL